MWKWFVDFFTGRDILDRENEISYLKAKLVVSNTRVQEIQRANQQRNANLRDRAKGCRLEVYKDKASEFRWRLKSRNHCIIAEGGEGYKRFENLEKSLNLVVDVIGVVEMHREK